MNGFYLGLCVCILRFRFHGTIPRVDLLHERPMSYSTGIINLYGPVG